ncbi:MAG: hypothetical protein JXD22_17230 [Sedimentisphaerales bacterium]|nr:hypothetical protein [Sedimentisphaerales bacterium]
MVSNKRTALIFLILLWGTSLAFCDELTVNTNESADYRTIQAAIDAAGSGDTIVVNPGCYQECIIVTGKSVTLRSSNPTDETVVAKTIIDGSGLGTVVTFGPDAGTDTLLSGFTITGGKANLGGGISCGPEMTGRIENCLIKDNSATGGGGIYINGGNPLLTNCKFENNQAELSSGNGGGLLIANGSSSVVSKCTFVGNRANNSGGGSACLGPGKPKFVDCVFQDNSAGFAGGGLNSSQNCNPALLGCSFIANSAKSGGGGGWHHTGRANDDNGDEFDRDLDPAIFNCSFKGNTASTGGGVKVVATNALFVNCLFAANRAVYTGGGLLSSWQGTSGSQPQLINCTFAGNLAGSFGGGISSNNSRATLRNCIVWGNRDSSGEGFSAQLHDSSKVYHQQDSSEIKFCCVQGWTATQNGLGNLGKDPMFVRSPGLVGLSDEDSYGDLKLRPGSPCIDAAKSDYLPPDIFDLDEDGDTDATIALDINNKIRCSDDPDTPDTGQGNGPIVDIGACEFVLE